jgi:hypothetical protein
MVPSPTIELHQQIEIAQQKNADKLAAELKPPRFELDTEALLALRHFKAWCDQRGVKSCPARPATAGAFVRSEAAAGVQPERIFDALQAIELLHDNAGLPNPIATAAVRAELGRILSVDAPRSWKKSDGLLFNGLPIEVRAVIARRARQDELAIRKLQNETATSRNQQSERKIANV